MRYYAHYGHNDFILCLGYGGDLIKEFFLSYNECMSNDFVMTKGGKEIQPMSTDMDDWTISFVDTGLHSNVGQRLRAVRTYLQREEVFLANYTDCLTDLPLPEYLDHFARQDKIASFLRVKPPQTFHVVHTDSASLVTGIHDVGQSDLWINAGFFAFKKEIFDYINEGEELVEEPFRRLIAKKELTAYKYDGFCAAMDTFKEKKLFDDMYATGNRPWEVWK
jgi:glucose-1-phosphate cytidylyltransferase